MKAKDFHKLNSEQAKSYFETYGRHPFLMTALSKDDDYIIYCTRQITDDTTKIDILKTYAVILMVEEIKVYSIISEMWYYTSTDNKPLVSPSKKSDRKESLFILTKHKNATVIIDAFEIIRDTDTAKNCELVPLPYHMKMEGLDLFEHINCNNISADAFNEIKKIYNELIKPDWYSKSIF